MKTLLVAGLRRRSAAVLVSSLLVSLMLLGISAPIGAQRVGGASSQERAALAKAQDQYASGDPAGAATVLENFLLEFPKSELRSEAATLLGHIRLEQKAYQPAIALLSDVLALGADGGYADRARLDLASAYLGVGDKHNASKLLAALAASQAAPGLRQQAYEMLASLAVEDHELERAVSFLMEERGLPPDVVDPAVVDVRIRELITQTTSPNELESIAEAYPKRFPADIALFQSAQLYKARGGEFDQERMLQTFLAAFPRHELAPEALAMLEGLRDRLRSAKAVIVLPLPYQGSLKPYATSLLHGAQLAVESGPSTANDLSIMLAARDYGGDLARLGIVLDQTCREVRCVAIVGPMLSREAPVVAARAAQWRIPAVSPTATGPMPTNRYLFRTALTAEAEGVAVAQYATQHLGMKRFVVLAPQDRYSVDVVTAFSEELSRQGGRLIFSASYETGAVDFGGEIKRLRQVDLQQEGVMETLPAENTAPDAPAPEPVYLPGFDAVFLPGDGETVGLIAAQLRFFDIAVPLLGSSGWNDRAVVKNGGKYVEDAIFVDAFFANSQNPAAQQFVKQYRARYGDGPDVFAALAYDATSLLVKGLKAGATTGERLRDDLTTLTGPFGVTGITGFGPGGDVRREFSWIQIRNGRFVPAL